MAEGAISQIFRPTTPMIRAEPVQRRSTARLDALLDAVAVIVDEIGFDRITTGVVAERAHASIGTVYRYFPDRLALLNALRGRAVQRFRKLVLEKVHDGEQVEVADAVGSAIDAFVQMHRTEPGFRVIQFEGATAAPEEDGQKVGFFAREFVRVIGEELGAAGGPDAVFHMEVIVETCDALISRAFQLDHVGEQRFIDEARTIATEYSRLHFSQAGLVR
ncbi:MAG: TetR/AcrR family transcriptional regulator [Microbacteriaceae bacterium]